MKNLIYPVFITILLTGCGTNEKKVTENTSEETDSAFYFEKYRPQLHFTPKQHWMNDPNGMVFHNNEYHLFYQYYPKDIVWGPMHWGHAVSSDLLHWEHLPIALYPDSLGFIFSGSAVVDKNNTAGFGDGSNTPLVAIFTYHSDEKQKAGKTDFQYQGIAYSVDNGRTWVKYKGNPVLKNQGIQDFRDPKVFWHDQSANWVMVLAVKDHVELWSSKDLKAWKKLSDFGIDYGGHGGVWECTDMVELPIEGTSDKKWVMIVNINPGGPNGGSATQYFTGHFDGKIFKADTDKKVTQWVDYGPDNYAGVTWSNAPDNRKIFAGWMSNWAYADKVPSERWRGALTSPRDLSLVKTPSGLKVKSVLSREFTKGADVMSVVDAADIKDSLVVNGNNTADLSMSVISGSLDAKNFAIEFANDAKEKLVIGYDASQKRYFLDRSNSGKSDFSPAFNGLSYAPRLSNKDKISFTVVSDVSSIEVFFDDGLSLMTALFYPDKPLSKVSIKAPTQKVEKLEVRNLKSVW
jgi:fructan beta-fructosidase